MKSTSLSTAPAAAAASAGGMVGGRSPENSVAPSGSTWTLSHPASPAPADCRVGVSNCDAKQMDELARYGRVETLQPPYHMFRRDIEAQTLPYSAEHDIGVLVYGPLAHGLLSGRMTPETKFPADDWRSHSSDFTGKSFRQNLHVIERLKKYADGRGLTLPQLAVAWTISHPAVHVAIIGARRASQLDGTLSRRRRSALRGGPRGDRAHPLRGRAGHGSIAGRDVTGS